MAAWGLLKVSPIMNKTLLSIALLLSSSLFACAAEPGAEGEDAVRVDQPETSEVDMQAINRGSAAGGTSKQPAQQCIEYCAPWCKVMPSGNLVCGTSCWCL